jgi:hypothetical protein
VLFRPIVNIVETGCACKLKETKEVHENSLWSTLVILQHALDYIRLVIIFLSRVDVLYRSQLYIHCDRGRLTSTVPFDLDDSGVPSPFCDFSGVLVKSMEYLVSVFDSPSCFPEVIPRPPGGFVAAAYNRYDSLVNISLNLRHWMR